MTRPPNDARPDDTRPDVTRAFLDGWLFVLREAVEGGQPGQGTAFLDGTNADGSDNKGLLATLDRFDARQASDAAPLGLSVAAHAAHTAYHMEVITRAVRGERVPSDWPGSFEPGVVDDAAWQATRERVRRAYEQTLAWAQSTTTWDEDTAGSLAATLAHVSYHLGAVRQALKHLL